MTLYSVSFPDATYHQIAFGFILISVVISNYLFIRQLRVATAADSGVDRHTKAVKTLRKGALTFVVGFIIWNIDNFFCDALRKGRNVLGPLGFILEGQ